MQWVGSALDTRCVCLITTQCCVPPGAVCGWDRVLLLLCAALFDNDDEEEIPKDAKLR